MTISVPRGFLALQLPASVVYVSARDIRAFAELGEDTTVVSTSARDYIVKTTADKVAIAIHEALT